MKKLYALCLTLFTLAIVSLASSPDQSVASGGCQQLNNGGITNQQFCPTPTPTPVVSPVPPSLQEDNLPQQTKGGQRIYPAAKTKATPNTGPEEWSLPVLFFLGGIGFLLRNKAKT